MPTMHIAEEPGDGLALAVALLSVLNEMPHALGLFLWDYQPTVTL